MLIQIDNLIRDNVSVVALCLALTLAFFFFNKRSTPKKSHSLPPKGPKFSEFLQVMTESTLAETQIEWVNKYGKLFLIPSPLPGIVPDTICTSDSEIMVSLNSTHINSYHSPYSFSRGATFASAVRATTGNGVTGMIGEEWRWRKTALLKEFHRSRLFLEDRYLFEAIVESGQYMYDTFLKASETGEIVLMDVVTTKAATDVIIFMLFGKKLVYDAESFRESANILMKHIVYSLVNPLRMFNLPQYFSMENKKMKARNIIDSVILPEIELLMKETENAAKAVYDAIEKGDIDNEQLRLVGTSKLPIKRDRKPHSVIESLLIYEPRFRVNITQVLEECRTFILAGFETTAHSLAFTYGLLAEKRNRHIDTLIVNDICKVLKDSKIPTRADIDATPNINYLFHEAIRLFPLAPALAGECIQDINICHQGETYLLPKSATVQFFNMCMQRDPNLAGESPDTVVLERWNQPLDKQPFIGTFNKGAHTCPGKPLSLLEAHTFLLCTVKDFQFEFPSDVIEVQYSEDLLLRPKNKMPLIIKKRQLK